MFNDIDGSLQNDHLRGRGRSSGPPEFLSLGMGKQPAFMGHFYSLSGVPVASRGLAHNSNMKWVLLFSALNIDGLAKAFKSSITCLRFVQPVGTWFQPHFYDTKHCRIGEEIVQVTRTRRMVLNMESMLDVASEWRVASEWEGNLDSSVEEDLG
jgi:hypothetical protein